MQNAAPSVAFGPLQVADLAIGIINQYQRLQVRCDFSNTSVQGQKLI
jgi:hypothetical protein